MKPNWIFAVSASGVALLGCTKPAPNPLDTPSRTNDTAPAKIVSIAKAAIGFPECSAGLDPRTVIRLAIPTTFSTVDPREVKYKNYKVGKDTDEGNGEIISSQVDNDGKEPAFRNNPFHINMDTLISYDPATPLDPEYVKVKVVLKNKAYAFQQVDRGAARTIYGVSREPGNVAPEPDPYAEWFCQITTNANRMPIRDNVNDRSVLTFFVRRHRNGDAVLAPPSINLHIISRGVAGGDTPIIIDPRIKNDG